MLNSKKTYEPSCCTYLVGKVKCTNVRVNKLMSTQNIKNSQNNQLTHRFSKNNIMCDLKKKYTYYILTVVWRTIIFYIVITSLPENDYQKT